jgi:hypothetical protein
LSPNLFFEGGPFIEKLFILYMVDQKFASCPESPARAVPGTRVRDKQSTRDALSSAPPGAPQRNHGTPRRSVRSHPVSHSGGPGEPGGRDGPGDRGSKRGFGSAAVAEVDPVRFADGTGGGGFSGISRR